MITLLNSPRLTEFGDYRYRQISLEEVKSFLAEGFQSAIGHSSTARILSELLRIEVDCRRINYRQQPGDRAIVFELNGRPPEGKVLELADIINIGYRFGLLIRIA